MEENLIGKRIWIAPTFETPEIEGTILNYIPAKTTPTTTQMNTMYGKDWRNKKCKNAKHSIRYTRVYLKNEAAGPFKGHHFVCPLNPIYNIKITEDN